MIQSTVFVQGQNTSVQDTIRQKFGIDMEIPADFVTALETDSLIWLRQEIPDISRSILVSRFAYTDPDQFQEPGIIRMRDRMGDRKSTRLNSSHVAISYAVFCLK